MSKVSHEEVWEQWSDEVLGQGNVDWYCNKSRGYDELLQRYQQLEQVAKEMWRFMLSCAITIEEEEEVEPFKIQLETLGVSLDD